MKWASNFFIFLSLIFLLLSLALYWERNNPKRLSFSSGPSYINNKVLKEKSSPPFEIKIKDLKIDLPVIPSIIKNQTWETTKNGASWLISSPVPGDMGNSILYGHNWTTLLGNLVYVKPGQKIEIIYKNKTKKVFTVTSLAIVSPKDVSILSQSKDSRITIYTCTGIFDDKRFVVVAKINKSFD